MPIRPPHDLPDPTFELDGDMLAKAAALAAPYIKRTRVVESDALWRHSGRAVFLKCENEQETGSFKVRGAAAKVLSLDPEIRRRGVVVASAGNHGLGVAFLSQRLKVPTTVVVSMITPKVKRKKLAEFDVELVVRGQSYDEAEQIARELAIEREATFLSPFDDPMVMAGNGGTIALEIRDQIPMLSAVLAPVGGGGLASGLGAALEDIPVIGINADASPAMSRTLSEGKVYATYPPAPTVADGLQGGVSATSAALCARHLHSIEVVREESLREAIRLVHREHGMAIEGSAAAGIAALLEGKVMPGKGPICIIVTGGNIDDERLARVLADAH